MARKPTKPRNPVIAPATASQKEAKDLFRFDAQRRLDDQQKILTAGDLSGEYEHIRALFTTLGGKPRIITPDDLQAFRARVNQIKRRHSAKGRFRGGIRIDQVIDFSASIDRERARREIRTAIPVSNKGGVVHFTTNASAKSESARHHVYVEMLDFAAWAASPDEPKKCVEKLIKSGPIRYDCDCGRHTFWYRYIASIGGFAYGRLEDGYPKVRNPKLHGVACKHVLRVMALFKSPSMKQYLIKMIERNRANLEARQKGNTVKEQEAFLQAVKKESSKFKGIAISAQARKEALMKQKTPESKVMVKAMEKATQKVVKKIAKSGKEKTIRQELKTLEENLRRTKLYDDATIKNMLTMAETSLRNNPDLR